MGGFWDNYYQFSNAVYGIRTGSYRPLCPGHLESDRSKLTLNLGLRYDYYIPQYDIHNEILGFFPGHQSTVFPNAPPDILYPGDPGTPNRALVYPDNNNFAPRVGFAWDMLGNAQARHARRLRYLLRHRRRSPQPAVRWRAAVWWRCPTSSTNSACSPPGPDRRPVYRRRLPTRSPLLPRADVGTFENPAIPYAYTTYPHFRTPYSENFNFGFQWQATKNMMLEAVYVGSLGRKLISTGETNFPSVTVRNESAQRLRIRQSECARPLAACAGGLINPPIP